MGKIDAVTSNDLWKNDIDGYFPVLLEIYNPDIYWSDEAKQVYGQDDAYLRIISDENKVVYKNKTYLPCSFEYTPPETEGGKIGTSQLSITALDYRVREVCRKIKIPSTAKVIATFVKVTKNEGTGTFIYKFVETSDIEFSMKVAGINKSTVTFTLSVNNDDDQSAPFDTATDDRCPSTKG